MFPWVCLATLPIFCDYSWPRNLNKKLFKINDIKYNKKNQTKTLESELYPDVFKWLCFFEKEKICRYKQLRKNKQNNTMKSLDQMILQNGNFQFLYTII